MKDNIIEKKVHIESLELSIFNTRLGKYISTKGRSNSKGVNLKIRVPLGWKIIDGVMPNVVMKFTDNKNTYTISVKNNITFYSRKEIRATLNNYDFVNKITQEARSNLINSKLLDSKIVTVSGYPAIQIHLKYVVEQLGYQIPIINKSWIIFYEDKIIVLSAVGNDNLEFKRLERLYFMITNSVIFPEEYE